MRTVEIIVPVYNEEEGLNRFYQAVNEVLKTLEEYDCSYLFVNDGSSDRSIEVIRQLAAADERVKYLSFSRNFGKEAAIYAGLQHCDADLAILIDADLQHPPELIPEMLGSVTCEGWDACGAKRAPGTFSRLFTSINNKMSTVKLQTGATDYMCMNRKFVQAVLSLCENQRFSKGLFAWVGYRVKWLDYVQGPRTVGRSKWNFRKLLSYAIDGLTGFSVIPLRVVSWAGAAICLLAVIYIIATLIKTLINGIDVPGYATLLVVLLFMGGIILLSVGILGSYIGRIFMESKNRPLYLLDETNLEKDSDRDKDER
ncbi:MAG: glycosyltransferase family 2 protein [Parasporobacterium sp.]|nr:glycosyltransferase family 2 protein [Parasporobacterium sp.]